MHQIASLFMILSVVSCLEIESPRPSVAYSSLTFYSNQTDDFLFSYGGLLNGLTTTADLWRFSISKSTWEKSNSSNPSLFSHSAVLRTITNSMIVYGGLSSLANGFFERNTNLYEFFPSNDTWSIIEQNVNILDDSAASYVEALDALIVYGAQTQQHICKVQLYFFGNHSWVDIHSSPCHKTSIDMVYMPETNSIYSYGGLRVDGDPYNQTVLSGFASFSLTDYTWKNLSSAIPLMDYVAVAAYPYIYLYGGCSDLRFSLQEGVKCVDVSSKIIKYDVRKDEWAIQELHSPRTLASGALAQNRVLYVYGGINQYNERVNNLQSLELKEQEEITIEGSTNVQPIGAIVGSVVGGTFVVLLAFSMYIFLRNRRNLNNDMSFVPLVSSVNKL